MTGGFGFCSSYLLIIILKTSLNACLYSNLLHTVGIEGIFFKDAVVLTTAHTSNSDNVLTCIFLTHSVVVESIIACYKKIAIQVLWDICQY